MVHKSEVFPYGVSKGALGHYNSNEKKIRSVSESDPADFLYSTGQVKLTFCIHDADFPAKKIQGEMKPQEAYALWLYQSRRGTAQISP